MVELPELQKQIINNNLDNLYIFTGEEIAIQKVYIDKIKEVSNKELCYVDDLKSIYNKLSSNDIFNTKRIYVIVDDIDLTKQEKVWVDLSTRLNGNIIILKYNNLDKRGKFYKYFKNIIVEFNKLSDDVLVQYIRKDLPSLSNENCKKLITICNGNYNQILLEIDKIKQYNDSYNNGNNDLDILFNTLDEQSAFHKEISDITFDFIDKVLKRQIKTVYELRKKLIEINESNIKILSLLYNSIRTVLLIQSCKSSNICGTTGLQYYQVKYNEDKKGFYTTGELINALRIIQKVESGIKMGKMEDSISLDYVLVNIL